MYPEFFVLAKMDAALRLLALPEVREIIPAMALSRPPAIGGACVGLANVRGETIPVFGPDGAGPLEDATKLIVILHGVGGHCIGLLVDDVLDVIALPRDDLRAQPIGRGRHARIAQREGQTLVVLTAGDILDAA